MGDLSAETPPPPGARLDEFESEFLALYTDEPEWESAVDKLEACYDLVGRMLAAFRTGEKASAQADPRADDPTCPSCGAVRGRTESRVDRLTCADVWHGHAPAPAPAERPQRCPTCGSTERLRDGAAFRCEHDFHAPAERPQRWTDGPAVRRWMEGS